MLVQVFSLIAKGEFSELKRKTAKAFHQSRTRRRVSKWRPRSILTPPKLGYAPQAREVGVFVHVYYSDFLPRIQNLLATYAEAFPNVVFNFTSTNADTHSSLVGLAQRYSNVGLVRQSVNRGRNFGPLLVDFQDEIPKFRFIVHIHTKKSLHAEKGLGEKWTDLLWGNLLENLNVFENNLALLREVESATLLYPIDLELFHPNNFSWAGAKGHLPAEIAQSPDAKFLSVERFPFPIGGMFMASSSGLKKSLLTRRWTLDDFPDELEQVDGTVHHALERIIGCLSWKAGAHPNEQIVFIPSLDAYTNDPSFCTADKG
jgi:lipopolysaccharide biosynthesis protein